MGDATVVAYLLKDYPKTYPAVPIAIRLACPPSPVVAQVDTCPQLLPVDVRKRVLAATSPERLRLLDAYVRAAGEASLQRARQVRAHQSSSACGHAYCGVETTGR